ncbi:hypothetical protein ACFE04_014939 [Oxalis oulophora]
MNSKIISLVKKGEYLESIKLYSKNPNFTTKFTFPSLLKASASLPNLQHGQSLHSTIITMGLQSDPFITTSLINMYNKCGSLTNAVQVFDKMSERDTSAWNAVIDGCFRNGSVHEGVCLFRRMIHMGIKPDRYSLSILLSEGVFSAIEGKQVHGFIVRNLFDNDPYLITALIEMYFSCNSPMDAQHIFGSLEDKQNVVVWNVMISGFCENGFWERSLELYSLGKRYAIKFVSGSFSCTITASSQGEDICFGTQIHCDVIKMGFETDPYVNTSLLTMYAKCGFVHDAINFFRQIPDKETELWNAMITAYVCKARACDALKVYNQMRLSDIRPDCFTVCNVLQASCMIASNIVGKSVHAESIKRNIEGNNALLTMYSQCGTPEDAYKLLSSLTKKNVISWGCIISGFCQSLKFDKALTCFKEMERAGVKPDSNIMASSITACAGLKNVNFGSLIHGFVIRTGLDVEFFVATSLIDMYFKCGLPVGAENVFSGIPHPNIAVWNSMISGYCKNGYPEKSITLLPRISQKPDLITLTSVLAAISSTSALLKGKSLHGYLIRHEIPSDIQLDNALLDMYIKCGLLSFAQKIFKNMIRKDLVSWNSMIAGYGYHGDSVTAMKMFDEMKYHEIMPDDITFLSLISCCNHSGLVEEGRKLFLSMAEYGVEPRMEHYVNMVDLLGRAGDLDSACSFIKKMAIDPDNSIWLSLLCACRTHQNLELGEMAADKLINLEPSRGSNYVQLLNIYGEAGMWDKVVNLRALMKERGVKKSPGCSWIEVRDMVHVFYSGDSSNTKSTEIYKLITCLRSNMKKRDDDEII